MFERNLERWTQEFSFIDAFTQRALRYPRFVWPVAKFILKNLKDEVELTERKERMRDNNWKSTESPSSLSKLSHEENYREHARGHRAKTDEALKDRKHQTDRKGKYERSFSSSESSMSVPG